MRAMLAEDFSQIVEGFVDEVESYDVEKVKTEHNEFEEEELQNHQAQF